jgi:hypothetical protein
MKSHCVQLGLLPRRAAVYALVALVPLIAYSQQPSTRKTYGVVVATMDRSVKRSAEPNSLAVRLGFDDRAELLVAAPDVYYAPDHYLNYTAVLVRLSRVTPDVLRDLLSMAHKL